MKTPKELSNALETSNFAVENSGEKNTTYCIRVRGVQTASPQALTMMLLHPQK